MAKTRSATAEARKTSGRRSAGTKEASRDRILVAARGLFTRSGYDGVSLSQIARGAHVAQPILYYYFEGKEDLWKAAIAPPFEQLAERLRDGGDLIDLSLEDQLRAGLRRYMRATLDNKDVAKTVIVEGANPSWRLDWLIERYLQPMHQLSEIMLRTLAPEARVPPAFIISMIIGTTHFFFGEAALIGKIHGVDPNDDAVADQFVEFIVGQVLAAIRR